MQTLYPKAQWRPLSNIQTEPNIGVPRLLIWHTMVGYLLSTERMFRVDGYSGTESTFGVGGPWDGNKYDGVVFQWQSATRQADAQVAGNAYALSIEHSDGGDPNHPLSAKQIEADVQLGLWFCEQTGHEPVPAKAWNGYGFGMHNMFSQWNPDKHSCPGKVREAQIREIIWPEIARRLGSPHPTGNPTPPAAQGWPKFPLASGNYYGLNHWAGIPNPEEGLRTWQQQMKHRGWTITADGQFGPETERVTKAFQKEKSLGVDGRIGLHTWNAAWTSPVT
jgi:peptidoglycan hydrolase-like protein with peptidoglycan-binding domain